MNRFRWMKVLGLVAVLLLGAQRTLAQAAPDTSLNTILRDSLTEQKEADLAERTQAAEPVAPVSAGAAAIKKPFQPNAKKSALFAAIVPGTGQIYNRQYWKVPVVYGLAGVAAYFLIDNTKQYRRYRKAYVSRLTNPLYKDEFSDLPDQTNLVTYLQTNQDYYKKNLDLTYLLTGVGYALQVIDALAFAHLKNFDVTPDITMRMAPVGTPNGGIGLGLVMNWK